MCPAHLSRPLDGGGGGGVGGGGLVGRWWWWWFARWWFGGGGLSCKPRDPLSKATLKLSHQKAKKKNGINACMYKRNKSIQSTATGNVIISSIKVRDKMVIKTMGSRSSSRKIVTHPRD